jgi:hypothetical protein
MRNYVSQARQTLNYGKTYYTEDTLHIELAGLSLFVCNRVNTERIPVIDDFSAA